MSEPANRIPEFIEALEKMKKIHIEKNKDYASSENPMSNFDVQAYFLGLFTNNRDKVFASMVSVKLARLANLLSSENKPLNESIEDTFIDAANYLLLWRADFIRRPSYRPSVTSNPSGNI